MLSRSIHPTAHRWCSPVTARLGGPSTTLPRPTPTRPRQPPRSPRSPARRPTTTTGRRTAMTAASSYSIATICISTRSWRRRARRRPVTSTTRRVRLASAATDGSVSRIVFDPADPTRLVYVSGNNHIHLLSGLVVFTTSVPCPTEPTLSDVDLSATATGTALGAQADDNPDWSPDGSKVIFDSTRTGVVRSLLVLHRSDFGEHHRDGTARHTDRNRRIPATRSPSSRPTAPTSPTPNR